MARQWFVFPGDRLWNVLQGTRFISKKGLRKLDELVYGTRSYGKNDGLRSVRERPNPLCPGGISGVIQNFQGAARVNLSLGKGWVDEQAQGLVQKFTFTLTPSDRAGNRGFSQVRAQN